MMRGFAEHVAPGGPGFLALVGPSVANVADDPEGAVVYAECVQQWRALPAATRARVLLVTLPLDDVDENAAMVNAIQRHATVIVQKSLAEGFGLTVAEGMWKGRPVVGSAVGGIRDQIAPGTGVLLPDARDLGLVRHGNPRAARPAGGGGPDGRGRARLHPRELPRRYPPAPLRPAVRLAARRGAGMTGLEARVAGPGPRADAERDLWRCALMSTPIHADRQLPDYFCKGGHMASTDLHPSMPYPHPSSRPLRGDVG